MLLVLDGARADRDVGQQVDEVLVVGGVEHLVGGEEARLLHHTQVHVANCLDALEQVVAGLGVGVVQQALVADALGARLVGVDPRNHDELVRDPLGQGGEARRVVKHGVLAVGGAWADDEQAPGVLAGEHRGHARVKLLRAPSHLVRERHLGTDVLGDGQKALELH